LLCYGAGESAGIPYVAIVSAEKFPKIYIKLPLGHIGVSFNKGAVKKGAFIRAPLKRASVK